MSGQARRTPTRQEIRWLRRLHVLTDCQPEGTWVFVANGVIHLMLSGRDGLPVTVLPDGIDQDYSLGSFTPRQLWDGGDW